MFKKRVKKDTIDIASIQLESSSQNDNQQHQHTLNKKEGKIFRKLLMAGGMTEKTATILSQSKAIKKMKIGLDTNALSFIKSQEVITKNVKQGLEEITGLIDKQYLKETHEDDDENEKKKQRIRTSLIERLEHELNERDGQREGQQQQAVIIDIQKDKAIEISSLIQKQSEKSENQKRFNFKIPILPLNKEIVGFSEVKFSYDQKAKSVAQFENARHKKLFGCDLFSDELDKSQQSKMSKEAQKEKEEKEFRHFQDKFLKRGRTFKLEQQKASDYNKTLDNFS